MSKLYILAACLLLSACGISKNLDKVGSGMDSMNARIKRMADNLDNMNGSIGSMSDSLAATKNSIRSQSLMLAQNEMLKSENTKYISLGGGSFIPLLPAAKAFSEMLSGDELSGIAYIYLSEINLAQVDAPVTQAQKDAYDLGKYVKLTALQLLSALAPQATIDAMVKSQIIDGGEYASGAYSVLVLRHIMIKDVLLEQLVGDGSIKLNKKQQATVDSYRKSLDIIQKYPFFELLTFKLYGFYSKELNQVLKLERIK